MIRVQIQIMTSMSNQTTEYYCKQIWHQVKCCNVFVYKKQKNQREK